MEEAGLAPRREIVMEEAGLAQSVWRYRSASADGAYTVRVQRDHSSGKWNLVVRDVFREHVHTSCVFEEQYEAVAVGQAWCAGDEVVRAALMHFVHYNPPNLAAVGRLAGQVLGER